MREGAELVLSLSGYFALSEINVNLTNHYPIDAASKGVR